MFTETSFKINFRHEKKGEIGKTPIGNLVVRIYMEKSIFTPQFKAQL